MALSLGARDLWYPDEPRYAEIAREMAERNEWIVPRLNGQVYHDKPSLLFWLVGISAKALGGFSNVSVRVPAFLAGLLLAGLTYLMGRQLFGRRVATLSALILMSTYQLLWFLPRLNMDTLFASGVAAAIFCFYLGLCNDASRRWAYPLAYFSMAVSGLTKGPAAFPLVAAAVLAIAAWRRDWKRLLGLVFSRGGLGGLAVLALVVGVWMVLVYREAGPGYLRSMLFDHNLAKAVNSHSHRAPFYTYLYYLPWAFSPWVVFLPAAAVSTWRKGKSDSTCNRRFILLAAGVMFVVMSASSAKRMNYLMSLMPFVSLIVGLDWARQWQANSMRTDLRWTAWGLAGVFATAGAASPFVVAHFHADFFVHAAAAGLLLFCGAAAMAVGLRRSNTQVVFRSLAGVMLLLGAYASTAFFPRLNKLKSLRPMAMELRALAKAEPNAKFATYRFSHPGALNFYSTMMLQEIRKGQDPRGFLDSDEPRYCIVDRKLLNELKELSRRPMRMVFEGRKGRNRLVCVTSGEPGWPRRAGP